MKILFLKYTNFPSIISCFSSTQPTAAYRGTEPIYSGIVTRSKEGRFWTP